MAGLTDEFDFQMLVQSQTEAAVALYAVSPAGMVFPFSEDHTFRAVTGWRVAYLDRPKRPAEDQQ